MKSFAEFIAELSDYAYDKYRNDAHNLGDRLWHRQFASLDAGSKARMQKRMDKLDRGIETATVLKMAKRAKKK